MCSTPSMTSYPVYDPNRHVLALMTKASTSLPPQQRRKCSYWIARSEVCTHSPTYQLTYALTIRECPHQIIASPRDCSRRAKDEADQCHQNHYYHFTGRDAAFQVFECILFIFSRCSEFEHMLNVRGCVCLRQWAYIFVNFASMTLFHTVINSKTLSSAHSIFVRISVKTPSRYRTRGS